MAEKAVLVTEETHGRLERVGNKGETFNEIVVRLLDAYEEDGDGE